MKDKKIQRQSFRVVVRIEIGPDGRVLHATFVTDSGNRDLDQQIQTALADAPPLKEVPPNYLRHDIEVRLSNRT
jgi:TonB family protein